MKYWFEAENLTKSKVPNPWSTSKKSLKNAFYKVENFSSRASGVFRQPANDFGTWKGPKHLWL